METSEIYRILKLDKYMTMDIIDKRIYSCNEAICKNIESLQANERGLLSQNILSQLRLIFGMCFFEDLCGFRQFLDRK